VVSSDRSPSRLNCDTLDTHDFLILPNPIQGLSILKIAHCQGFDSPLYLKLGKGGAPPNNGTIPTEFWVASFFGGLGIDLDLDLFNIIAIRWNIEPIC